MNYGIAAAGVYFPDLPPGRALRHAAAWGWAASFIRRRVTRTSPSLRQRKIFVLRPGYLVHAKCPARAPMTSPCCDIEFVRRTCRFSGSSSTMRLPSSSNIRARPPAGTGRAVRPAPWSRPVALSRRRVLGCCGWTTAKPKPAATRSFTTLKTIGAPNRLS